MEQTPDVFASLEQEIDWETQFTEAAGPLFATLQAGETGQELIDQTANLLAMAEHQGAFARMQLLAQLGDLCCNNPNVAEAFQASSFFEEMMQKHNDCDDDHQHTHTKDKKHKKKRKKSDVHP